MKPCLGKATSDNASRPAEFGVEAGETRSGEDRWKKPAANRANRHNCSM